MRRLPVYILIDTSSSMRGEPIEAVKIGLESLISSLRCDPYALETACLSIITYNTTVQQLMPLTEVYKMQLPNIEAKGRSALGEALLLLTDKVNEEVRKTTSGQKGDWKPLLFILSDGGYSGPIAKPIKEYKKNSFGFVVACAAGSKAHIDVLNKLTNNVIQINSLEPSTIKSYFKWVSNSISATSMKIEDDVNDSELFHALPPVPDNITILKSVDSSKQKK